MCILGHEKSELELIQGGSKKESERGELKNNRDIVEN